MDKPAVSDNLAVLLLNASYEVIGTISWQRAVTLGFLGKVEVVEIYDAQVKGVNVSIDLPSVVRLRKYARQERKARFSRTSVYRRDGYECQYCGNGFDGSDLTLDHVNPRSKGGKTDWTNIVAACRPCNARKADRTPEQAKMKLRSQPARPMSVDSALPAHVHPTWEAYIQ